MPARRDRFERIRQTLSGLPILLGSLVLAVGLMAPSPWADEGGRTYQYDPEAKLEKLTRRLSLTEEQQAKIRPILQENTKQMQALRQQVKQLREQTAKSIEAELTEEQAKQFRNMREERKKKMRKHRGKKGKGKKKQDNDDDDKDD